MSVIINQLDVVITPEPPSVGPPDSASPPPTPPVPTPLDLRDVVRHLAERADRARAD
jgi:hypothetical protein